MDTKRLQQLAGMQLTEELDVSEHDPLRVLIKYMQELQLELEDTNDPEIRDYIEQDIFDLGQMIQRKKQRASKG